MSRSKSQAGTLPRWLGNVHRRRPRRAQYASHFQPGICHLCASDVDLDARRRSPPSVRVWWKGAVIYQIYMRSFADVNGDGIGDLRGRREPRPYLRRLLRCDLDLAFLQLADEDFGYDVAGS